MQNNNTCVYTTLIGDYEELNEQPVANSSNIDFICFTDNSHLKSKTWRIVHVEPVFPLDKIRSSRVIKIVPHRYLSDYETSLYIDNSVELKLPPEQIFNEVLSKSYDFYCAKHSFRDTVIDEYDEIIKLNFDNYNVVIEQLNTYSIIDPDLFNEKPYWGGFLIRNHQEAQIINAMEDWLAQVLRYSRRDQLSLNYIIRRHKIQPKILNFDLYSSKFHDWPTAIRHGNQKQNISLISTLENNIRATTIERKYQTIVKNNMDLHDRLAQKEKFIDELNKQFEELKCNHEKANQSIKNLNKQLVNKEQEVLYYANSKSWLITRPLRKFWKIFRDINIFK